MQRTDPTHALRLVKQDIESARSLAKSLLSGDWQSDQYNRGYYDALMHLAQRIELYERYDYTPGGKREEAA